LAKKSVVYFGLFAFPGNFQEISQAFMNPGVYLAQTYYYVSNFY
jgi:hypothetical protein